MVARVRSKRSSSVGRSNGIKFVVVFTHQASAPFGEQLDDKEFYRPFLLTTVIRSNHFRPSCTHYAEEMETTDFWHKIRRLSWKTVVNEYFVGVIFCRFDVYKFLYSKNLPVSCFLHVSKNMWDMDHVVIYSFIAGRTDDWTGNLTREIRFKVSSLSIISCTRIGLHGCGTLSAEANRKKVCKAGETTTRLIASCSRVHSVCKSVRFPTDRREFFIISYRILVERSSSVRKELFFGTPKTLFPTVMGASDCAFGLYSGNCFVYFTY